jgi:hypothetical protein
MRQYWSLNACAFEIAPARLAELKAHAQVIRLIPDEERHATSITAGAPIAGSKLPENHAVGAAHTLLPHLGAGAVVAIFDSGIDLDQTGTRQSPDPDVHNAFRDANLNSRVLAHVQVGTIDCNTTTGLPPQAPAVDPWCPQQNRYRDARHGTGVAAVAVGRADPSTVPPLFDFGHAPGAQLLSFSISNQPNPWSVNAIWPTDASTFLAAVQALESWILAAGGVQVHVLNISWAGWSDPQDPTQHALDLLERDFDILVVTGADNDGDATFFSHGYVNGLSVGNVHKFWSPTSRWPDRQSSRGPLFMDPDRLFPDVCATGSATGVDVSPFVTQVVMPLIDYLHTNTPSCRGTGLNQQNYSARGSSISAPQVSGAAALYRTELPQATAQETRAAILLASIDPLLEWTGVRHTYMERNAVGVGYTRDDLLARYAKRMDNTLGQSVQLANQNPVTTTYLGLTEGQYYAVAIAWPRVYPPGFDPASGVAISWANVDLEVRKPNGELLARSDSTRNTYERLVFKADGVTSVHLVVQAVEHPGLTVPVFIAARSLASDGIYTSKRSISGYVTSIAQDSACVQSTPDQAITRTAPAVYRQAYGSQPFRMTPSGPYPFGASNDQFRGFNLHISPSSPSVVDNLFASDAVFEPGVQTIRIRGLAMRTWSPFSGCNTQLGMSQVWLYKRTGTFNLSQMLNGVNGPPQGVGDRLVAQNVSVPVFPPAWLARRWDTWPIIIPFSQPFDLQNGEHLGVWITFGSLPAGCLISVDGTWDVGWPYGSVQTGSNITEGYAIIFGLIEGELRSLSPMLDVYGWPQVGQSVLFHVRQAGIVVPPPTIHVYLGWTNPNLPFGSCRVLSMADYLGLGPVTASAMGDAVVPFTFPNDPVLLHRHMFVQATTSSGALLSNGLRLTIGGIVP